MRTIKKATLVAHCHCQKCGRDSHVEAAKTWWTGQGYGAPLLHGIFGSAADFCEFCDTPYEGEHVYEIVDKSLDKSADL